MPNTCRSRYTIITDVEMLSTRDFMTSAAEAPDGSYVLAFGHTGGKRTILKLDPASAWFIAVTLVGGGVLEMQRIRITCVRKKTHVCLLTAGKTIFTYRFQDYKSSVFEYGFFGEGQSKRMCAKQASNCQFARACTQQ